MIRETCNKCGNEVTEDRKLDNNVWNCINCGLEEYQSVDSSINEVNKEDLPKYYLNKEQTVFIILSEDTATIKGDGKIYKKLWNFLKKN